MLPSPRIGGVASQRVLVTGTMCSGTASVGQALAWPRSVDYLHEPLNPRSGLPSVNQAFLDLAGLSGHRRSQVYSEIDALLRYEPVLRTGYYRLDTPGRRLVKRVVGSRGPAMLRVARSNPFSSTVVLQDPFAVMSVEVLMDEWGVVPIAVLRHPVGVAASMARRGWEPSLMLASMAEQPAVLDRLHRDDRELLGRTMDDEWQAAALLWRITARELLRLTAARASLTLLTYEAVLRAPVDVLHALYAGLGLPWSEEVRRRAEHGGRAGGLTREDPAAAALDVPEPQRRAMWDLVGDLAEVWYTVDGVRSEASDGLVTPMLDEADQDEVLHLPATERRGRDHDLRIRVEGPVGMAPGLSEQMIGERCQHWLQGVLATEEASGRWADVGGPELNIIAGGLIGPSDRGVAPGWMPPLLALNRVDHLLMGVGWAQPDRNLSLPATLLSRWSLSRQYLHAVRDQGTREHLVEAGVHNVVVTGCPTTWGLDVERIRTTPGRRALVALRHDLDDEHLVSSLVSLLSGRYESILLQPLHPRDRRFLPLLPRSWEVLPMRLEVLDALLAAADDLDYVGTSAHTGIRALESGARAFILDGDPQVASVTEPVGVGTWDRRDLGALGARLSQRHTVRLRSRAEIVGEWLGQFLWATPRPGER